MIVQSIPGSMQAVADHILQPVLAQADIIDHDKDASIQCCEENNLQDANICNVDCRVEIAWSEFTPDQLSKNFEILQVDELARTLSAPDLRPPIS